MAELKTQKNNASVKDFIKSVEHPTRRTDALVLLNIFEEVTGEKAVMWGDSIVGFGEYYYESSRSNQSGYWMLTAFSPRKQNLSLYIMKGANTYPDLLAKLGKHKTSKGACLYINKLADVDMTVLKELIHVSYQDMKNNPTYC